MFGFLKRKKQEEDSNQVKEVVTKDEQLVETPQKVSVTIVEELVQDNPNLDTEQVVIHDSKKEDEAVKRYTFSVKGTFVKERQKEIVKLVKELKKAEYFYEAYDGLKPKEIKEDYFEEPIYEYGGCSLPKAMIEEENNNPYDEYAIKVFISNLNGDFIHIGYVPKELCEEIREMKGQYDHYVVASLEGGKYKMATYDEYGEEKVKVFNDKEYGIELCVSFWEELPQILKNKKKRL
ncbi:hypothetical protein [Priestia aryabhattai]|uniref:hypothetical protein n=1 Tax=Priestia aryabhattai TaxID=412384 RepID=UPI003683633A